MNPNLWQAAPSGHLLPGESYAEGARRELREEVGPEFAQKITSLQPVTAVRVYSDASMGSHAQKENFYFFMAQADEETSKLASINYEADGAEWVGIDTIRKMMVEDPTQFRDAFRLAFGAVDWGKTEQENYPDTSASV